jgi:hypothetical protein
MSEPLLWKPGRFRIERPHTNAMRVPDFVLKCAAFVVSLAESDASGDVYDLEGTGFFVGVPAAVQPYSYFYFVTAKHVVDNIKGKSGVRVNVKNAEAVVMPIERWFFHPSDPSADVAVAPFKMTPNLDVLSLRREFFTTREEMAKKDIGVGDEVFFPGLFSYASGTKHNHPILRHGNVAMLPVEQVQTEVGYMDAYLIEARSISGLSGSPVFVRRTISISWNEGDPEPRALHGLTGNVIVLGMAHGHWDIKPSEINDPTFKHDHKTGVNVGISIVIPAHKILETLDLPELAAERKRNDDHWRSQILPTMDRPKS